jgi:hypothetical protein
MKLGFVFVCYLHHISNCCNCNMLHLTVHPPSLPYKQIELRSKLYNQPVHEEDDDDEKEVGVQSSSSSKRLISAGVDDEEEEVTLHKKSKENSDSDP